MAHASGAAAPYLAQLPEARATGGRWDAPLLLSPCCMRVQLTTWCGASRDPPTPVHAYVAHSVSHAINANIYHPHPMRVQWYPLGRPVGTTIYPGMQMVAVALWKLLKLKQWKTVLGFSVKMSLNDVCVFMPAWFGAVASVIVGLLTTEASGSSRAGAAAALVMAVVPAHLMRSIGGGYDNESVAMTAMVLTFYLWVRSLRSKNSWWIGFFAGLAYAFMAAAWGESHTCC